MLYQQLKEKTHSSHQALEKKLIARIKNIQSPEDYVDLLKLMYGYYASIERRLELFLADHPNLHFNNRRKASSILNDIRKFQSASSLPYCEQLPSIASNASALGALYVLEGSTLGGEIITRIITGQLRLPNSEGLEFFLSYGEERHKMWELFKENLSKPFNESEQEEIILTANETFITFKNWIDTYAAN